jgi:hypothetical protein
MIVSKWWVGTVVVYTVLCAVSAFAVAFYKERARVAEGARVAAT